MSVNPENQDKLGTAYPLEDLDCRYLKKGWLAKPEKKSLVGHKSEIGFMSVPSGPR